MRAALRFVPALLLAVFWAAAPVPAQQPSPQQPKPQTPPAGQAPAQPPATPAGQPQFRSGINFISVDVIVTADKTGEPVLDLKPGDFDVREDGKPQKVQTFQVIKLDNLTQQVSGEPPPSIKSDADEEREAKRPDVRLFLLFLDDYHVRRGNDLSVRQPLTQFVQNQLGPNDMIAVMYPLTPVTALSFTRDHDSVVKAIEHFEGRKGIYTPRNEFEERYANYPAQQVEEIRTEVTLSALKGAAVKLGGMREGRKSIIFVSEGFITTLPAQLNDPVASIPGYGNPLAGAAGVDLPNTPYSDAQRFFGELDLDGMLRNVYDAANRNNTSIYAVDPRGLAGFEYDINQGVSQSTDRQDLAQSLDSLRVLADNTDGRAIINRNDLGKGMKQIIRDSSGYYLIGYTSSAAPTDGKFHKIDVKLVGKHPGLDVRARKGYWAYTVEDAARATAAPKPEAPSAVRTALNDLAEPVRGRAARFWIGTARAADGKANVTFVWEPIPPAPGDRPDSDTTAARVALTATAPDGRPLFHGRVPDTAGTDGATTPANRTDGSQPSPAGASATFEAPPGPIQLRMLVEGSHGQVVDSTVQDLTVPDFTKVQVSMSTPRVYRTRTPRQMQEIRANPNAAPTADRDFSRTDRLLVRFDTYAPGGATPQTSAKLLNRAGQSMADVPVQAAGGPTYQADLPLASLAAGEYLLQLDAKTASGTARQLVAFKVGA
ncbi:MAG TPA: VWA domain-containing protein [Vicinamibacterales bacterium]|nr:VWA domain-containing protein [Vicinamibacterales bacterium]